MAGFEAIVVTPIGVVHGGRTEPTDDDWGQEQAVIELDSSRFGSDSVADLSSFSHLEVVFSFHLVDEEAAENGARRPRGRSDWPLVGIFAQRAKRRPNRIGVSRCRLLSVDGATLSVQGLDAVDGSPVLDIKPYMVEFGPRGEVRQPAWSHEVMREYYDGDRK
ncbi:MAG: hypothetical protein QOE53_390 [Pseudonocardiales bacterium]|jgi:tRNA-Thr(GGU) m(6)t(6)A37 methyltransferase TsaA|nr:hypothetical protein [Pseudonocardiales bacterium]